MPQMTPVADQINPPNPGAGLNMYSQILGIKQQQQALVAETAQAQQQQQTARQRAGLAQWWQNTDLSKHIGPDGTIDLNNILSDPTLRQAAGDSYPQIVQNLITAKNGQLQNKQALAGLNDTLRSQFMRTVGALRNDPDVQSDNPAGRQKVESAITSWADSGGPDAKRIAGYYESNLNRVPQGHLASSLGPVQLQAMSADAQARQQAPDYTSINTGSHIVNAQTNPLAAGGVTMPSQLQNTFTPGERYPLGTNAAGQTVLIDRQGGNMQVLPGGPVRPFGSGAGGAQGGTSGGVPSGASGGTPANPSSPQVAGETKVATAGAGVYANTLAGASELPVQRNVLQNIIKLAPQTISGPESQRLATLQAALGDYVPGMKSAKDLSTAYQEETKFMEQNALRAWQAAGGSGSNSQLEAQVAANPNNQYNPETVKALAKWNLAGVDAAQARANAMSTWMGKNGSTSQSVLEFNLKWADVMDPRVFQVGIMSPQEVLKSFPSKAEREDIARKIQNYKAFEQSLGAQQ